MTTHLGQIVLLIFGTLGGIMLLVLLLAFLEPRSGRPGDRAERRRKSVE